MKASQQAALCSRNRALPSLRPAWRWRTVEFRRSRRTICTARVRFPRRLHSILIWLAPSRTDALLGGGPVCACAYVVSILSMRRSHPVFATRSRRRSFVQASITRITITPVTRHYRLDHPPPHHPYRIHSTPHCRRLSDIRLRPPFPRTSWTIPSTLTSSPNPSPSRNTVRHTRSRCLSPTAFSAGPAPFFSPPPPPPAPQPGYRLRLSFTPAGSSRPKALTPTPQFHPATFRRPRRPRPPRCICSGFHLHRHPDLQHRAAPPEQIFRTFLATRSTLTVLDGNRRRLRSPLSPDLNIPATVSANHCSQTRASTSSSPPPTPLQGWPDPGLCTRNVCTPPAGVSAKSVVH